MSFGGCRVEPLVDYFQEHCGALLLDRLDGFDVRFDCLDPFVRELVRQRAVGACDSGGSVTAGRKASVLRGGLVSALAHPGAS